jgi:RecB family exonuclease
MGEGMSDRFQLHVSGLNLLAKCGIQFEKRYLEGLRTPASVSMAVGTAVDQSVTTNLREKKHTGALLAEEQVKDIARDALAAEWDRGVEAAGEDAEEGLDTSRDAAIDMSVDLASLHHQTVAPMIAPTHVQRSWTLDIDGLPLQLAGTIDIQEANAIRDTKTSAKSPLKTLADSSLQLTTYALAVNAHDGAIPDKVALDYLVRTPKRREKKFIQLTSSRTRTDFLPLLERVYQAHRTIESGIFTPAPPDAWWCSRKFCPYWNTCPYAVRPVSLLMNGTSNEKKEENGYIPNQ